MRHLRSLITLAALAVLAAVTAGCDLSILGLGGSDDGTPAEITELPRALTTAEVRLLDASNAFAFDLLGELVKAAPERSHLISPLSVSMALGMALNGAAGETFDAMRGTLRLEGLSEAEINASFAGLVDLLKDLDPRVSFDLGNSVWYRDDLTLQPSFLEAAEGPFEARVQGVDFMNPATPGVINAWVDGRTHGRIPEIVPDPLGSAQVVMYLLNAIYFKGDWRDRFDPAETVDGDFHLPDGSTAPARFMTDRRTVDYWHGGTYQAVDIPYGGKAFSMTVVVPRGSRPVGDVVETLRNGEWETVVQKLKKYGVEVGIHLPRFTLEWGDTLNAPLESLGMGVAFAGCEADFSRLFVDDTGCTYINQVRHKTFIRVDEEGTEAAAATVIDFLVGGPPSVRADRPFLYAIRERLSGTILFLGVMVEPPELPVG